MQWCRVKLLKNNFVNLIFNHSHPTVFFSFYFNQSSLYISPFLQKLTSQISTKQQVSISVCLNIEKLALVVVVVVVFCHNKQTVLTLVKISFFTIIAI